MRPSLIIYALALMYEVLILIVIWIVGVVLLTSLHYMGRLFWPSLPMVPLMTLSITNLLLIAYYFIFQWTKTGQTLAAKTWRIRIVHAHTGLALHRKAAMQRFMWAVFFYLACPLFIYRLVDLASSPAVAASIAVCVLMTLSASAYWHPKAIGLLDQCAQSRTIRMPRSV